jgi:hypothetical protein
MNTQHFQHCGKCSGYVDTTKYYITAMVNGMIVYLHPDFCADYYPATLDNVERHNYHIKDTCSLLS